MLQPPRSMLVTRDHRPRDKTDFAATSALILFVAFVALVFAAGYVGHMLAGQS